MSDNPAVSEKPAGKYFTLDEVAKHDNEKDCWIVIDGKVLDITPFLSQHPGGDDILLQDAGKDLTSEFEDTGHSSDARKQLEKYVVGLVEGAPVKPSKSEKKAVAAASGEVNPAVLVAIVVAILAALYLLLNP